MKSSNIYWKILLIIVKSANSLKKRKYFRLPQSIFLCSWSERRSCLVPRNCIVSSWTTWSICSAPCGQSGHQNRTRHVIGLPIGLNSVPCGELLHTRPCSADLDHTTPCQRYFDLKRPFQYLPCFSIW